MSFTRCLISGFFTSGVSLSLSLSANRHLQNANNYRRAGFATIPSGGGGTLVGGYLVKRLRLHCTGILRLCIVTTSCALVLTLSLLVRCADMDFAGVNVDYATHTRYALHDLRMVCALPYLIHLVCT